MRHCQSRLLDQPSAVEHDVEVEGARCVGKIAHPAMEALDLEQRIEQRARREAGINGGHGIDEVGLVEIAHGRAAVER